MGNLKQVNEPNPAQGADYVTSYTYDLLSHLTQVSMPRPSGTQTRTFVYDPTAQRLSSETHPESGAKSYTYNADGTVATRTDARGVITHYTYDSFQRVTLIQDGTACEQVTIAYDQGTNGWGRPYTYTWGGATCVGSLTFIYKYGYTPAGRVSTKGLAANRSNGNLTLTAGYTYDNEGHLTSIAYPDSTTGLPSTVPLTYSLDVMGRPTALSSTNNGVVTYAVQNAQYGPSDELFQVTYPPGGGYSYTETRHYNSRLQLTEMQTPWSDYQYVYSPNQNNGRITQATGTGGTVSYTYDSLNRLATASSSGSWAESFTYDGFGNLTDKTPTAGSPPALHITVNATTNRINGDSYDANGNLTSSPQGGGGYDGENRLVTSMSEKYSYGPDNLRVYKQHPDGSEELYFNGLRGERLQVYHTAGPLTSWGNGGTLLYFAGRAVDGNYRDRLGSVQWFWRYGGPPPTYTGYYPYGEEYTTTTQDREKFATYYRDGTTALDYAKNRYYSSILGRFMSADPYMATASGANNPADPGSWNRYAYALNDPVKFNDPSGLGACDSAEGPATGMIMVNGTCVPGALFSLALDNFSGASQIKTGNPHGSLDGILRRQAVDAIRNLSHQCQQALTDDGFNLQLISITAASTEFYSADSEGTFEVRNVSGYVNPVDPSETLRDYLGSSRAGTLPNAAGAASNYVVVGRLYFTKGAFGQSLTASQNTTLVHEALHTGTGLGDVAIYEQLDLGTIPKGMSASDALAKASNGISSWLANGCPPII
jgi:RHS repeat-associated protein